MPGTVDGWAEAAGGAVRAFLRRLSVGSGGADKGASGASKLIDVSTLAHASPIVYCANSLSCLRVDRHPGVGALSSRDRFFSSLPKGGADATCSVCMCALNINFLDFVLFYE